eukprot:TRINITY_DN19304_c0_g1_i1.p1 TRINITY_DN19304_c0_g1~~TRINITY_DN19304_c0_g1_i1.p1  ORF type:complete len:642 (+),score=95.83 TRINITY_DN19304_c0_g1_i1:129-2054(+)
MWRSRCPPDSFLAERHASQHGTEGTAQSSRVVGCESDLMSGTRNSQDVMEWYDLEACPEHETTAEVVAGAASENKSVRVHDHDGTGCQDLEVRQEYENALKQTASTRLEEACIDPEDAEASSSGESSCTSSEDMVGWHTTCTPVPPAGALSGRHVTYEQACEWMKHMKASRPEILRACPASVALLGCGKLLRSDQDAEALSAGFMEFSYMVESIQEFWSHSWQAHQWHKIMMLKVLHNGFPAVAAGTFGALLGALLSSFDLLPGYVHVPGFSGNHYKYSAWSLLIGTLSSCITFFFWRSNRSVFFDRVCIHQTDSLLKTEGVASIGAFVKKSRSMLVLWDVRYFERLWCVFEMAAFLRSHQDASEQSQLSIRPIMLGPFTLTVYAVFVVFNALALHTKSTNSFASLASTLSSIASLSSIVAMSGAMCIHCFRKYHRDLTAANDHLKNFSAKRTKCTCCAVHHVNPMTGQQMSCDRKIVFDCIRFWFGSLGAFECSVRVSVLEDFRRQLGKVSLPYAWLLGACSPALWAEMDTVAARLRAGEVYYAMSQALASAAFCFCIYPLSAACCHCLAEIFQRKYKQVVLNLAVSLFAAVLVGIAFGCTWGMWMALHWFCGDSMLANVVFLSVTGSLTLCVWSPCQRS